jgi:hypothetical protein
MGVLIGSLPTAPLNNGAGGREVSPPSASSSTEPPHRTNRGAATATPIDINISAFKLTYKFLSLSGEAVPQSITSVSPSTFVHVSDHSSILPSLW